MSTLTEFPSPGLYQTLQLRGFKVHRSQAPTRTLTTFGRRHFYKIVLSIGHATVQYGDQVIPLEGAYLFFASPQVPYAAEIHSAQQTSYVCVFTERFIQPLAQSASWQQSPLHNVSGTPFFELDAPAQARLTALFERMLAGEAIDYRYKDDLMRTCLQLLIHEALLLRPAEYFRQFTSALARVSNRFLELLEQQFPVESLTVPLRLKTAQDYAAQLAVHVNYLNRAVKHTTGKSTTTYLAERITAEAVALLQQTEWSIADIAHALGFEYPNYFSNFIKKTTGNMPKFYRSH
jgi:AraC-like DNA-binding protein